MMDNLALLVCSSDGFEPDENVDFDDFDEDDFDDDFDDDFEEQWEDEDLDDEEKREDLDVVTHEEESTDEDDSAD